MGRIIKGIIDKVENNEGLKINTECMTIRISKPMKQALEMAKWKYKCSQNQVVVMALKEYLNMEFIQNEIADN